MPAQMSSSALPLGRRRIIQFVTCGDVPHQHSRDSPRECPQCSSDDPPILHVTNSLSAWKGRAEGRPPDRPSATRYLDC